MRIALIAIFLALQPAELADNCSKSRDYLFGRQSERRPDAAAESLRGPLQICMGGRRHVECQARLYPEGWRHRGDRKAGQCGRDRGDAVAILRRLSEATPHFLTRKELPQIKSITALSRYHPRRRLPVEDQGHVVTHRHPIASKNNATASPRPRTCEQPDDRSFTPPPSADGHRRWSRRQTDEWPLARRTARPGATSPGVTNPGATGLGTTSSGAIAARNDTCSPPRRG